MTSYSFVLVQAIYETCGADPGCDGQLWNMYWVCCASKCCAVVQTRLLNGVGSQCPAVMEVSRPGLVSRPVSRPVFAGLSLGHGNLGLGLVLLRSPSRSKQLVETTETSNILT